MKDKFPTAGTPYDLWEPPKGHEERFRIRLAKQAGTASSGPARRRRRVDWSQWFVAASVLFLGLVWWWTQPGEWKPLRRQTAGIIRQVESHRSQWEQMWQQELRAAGWDKENTGDLPGAGKLIEDAFSHLQRLQKDYEHLEDEFQKGGHYRTLDAMIRNKEMQHRILSDLKQQLLELRNRQIYEKQSHQS